MSLALIIIPDPPTLSGEYGSDGQQPGHLLRLEDPAFRVDGQVTDKKCQNNRSRIGLSCVDFIIISLA
jgi:hypothetical protein